MSCETFLYRVCVCVSVASNHDPVVHWSRWRALVVLIVATFLTAACADLTTEHIKPIISHASISQVCFSTHIC